MVVSLHDLTFEHGIGTFRPGQQNVFRAQARHAARTARLVFTGSEHVKADVVTTYAIPPERVVVTPYGTSAAFRPGAQSTMALPPAYVVAMGGAARRRLDLAVGAWRRSECGLPLVVLGTGPPDTISLTDLVDDEWAGVLAGARAFLYPTEYEGYGLPGAEAQAVGTPVVAARVGSLPEVLTTAAEWSEDLSVEALAHALLRALARSGRPVPVPASWLEAAALMSRALGTVVSV